MPSCQLRTHLGSQVSLPSKLQKSGAKGKVPLPPRTFSSPYPAHPWLILPDVFQLVLDLRGFFFVFFITLKPRAE